jgi:hypothetical protein
MVYNKTNSSQEKLEAFVQLLESSRQLQQDILTRGLDAAYLYVEDVEGDWLENWDEDEEDLETETDGNLTGEKFEKTTLDFLNRDDPVVVKVRDKLKEKSLAEIAAELEKCLMLPKEGDRQLFAVKELLGSGVSVGSKTRGNNDEDDDEIEMLELAEDLLEKLVEFLERGNDRHE